MQRNISLSKDVIGHFKRKTTLLDEAYTLKIQLWKAFDDRLFSYNQHRRQIKQISRR